MTHFQAAQCFDENSQLISDSKKEPYIWNLSVGLAHLARAIQSDQQKTERLLNQILNEVQAMRIESR